MQASSSCHKQGLLSSCSVRASHCSGFSCRVWALGRVGLVAVTLGLLSAASVSMAHGLSCPEACGTRDPPGLNPCPLYWQADS